MTQFLKPNLGLCVGRQGQAIPGAWNIVFATRHPEDQNLFYRGGNTNFPLYLYPDASELGLASHKHHNLSRLFLDRLSERLSLPRDRDTGLPHGLTPEDIFHYVYAVLHSPTYRNRFEVFLKVDFPRLPLTRNLELLRALARLGGELVSLHLLDSSMVDHSITTYSGPPNPKVGRVGWVDDTVWLDAPPTRRTASAAPPGTIGFRGVPEVVWNFHIGGYQVCEKWLKDRKGRKLSKDDVEHYHRIVVALYETIRLMGEIDRVIKEHGGWPGAFVTGPSEEDPE
jgi:predicted helicase